MLNKIKTFFSRKESTPVVTASRYSHDFVIPEYNRTLAMKKYNSWVAVAININAAAIAALPLKLYVRKTSRFKDFEKLWNYKPVKIDTKKYLRGDEKIRPSTSVLKKTAKSDFYEVVDEHPILTLLDSVNSGFNHIDLVKLRIVYLQLLGNAYIYVEKDKRTGLPLYIQPLPADGVYIQTKGEGYEKIITGYTYGYGDGALNYDYTDVVHFKRHNLADSLYGLGDLELGWNCVYINEYEHIYKRTRLENQGRLDSIITLENADKIGIERFEREFKNKFTGPNKAAGNIFVNKDVKINPLHYEKIDLKNYDENNIREIGAVFGVPENKLLGNSPIKANSENQDVDWLRTTIASLARADEQKLNEQLLPMYGQELAENAFLAYDNPVPKDKEFIMKRNVAYVKAGIITSNEAREEEGYDPRDDGDELKRDNSRDREEESVKSVSVDEEKMPVSVNIYNKILEDDEKEEINTEKKEGLANKIAERIKNI